MATGGETIKDIQNFTGCKINVSQPSGPEREIGLVGTRSAIEHAKQAINDKVRSAVRLPIWSCVRIRTDLVQDENTRPGGGGGGGGAGGRQPPNQYENYSQPAQSYDSPVAGAYGGYAAAPYQQYSQQPMSQVAGPGAGQPVQQDDPYAQYGGYEAYAAWYAYVNHQKAQGANPPGQS